MDGHSAHKKRSTGVFELGAHAVAILSHAENAHNRAVSILKEKRNQFFNCAQSADYFEIQEIAKREDEPNRSNLNKLEFEESQKEL